MLDMNGKYFIIPCINNFDNTINSAMEPVLLNGKSYGLHIAWNFIGYVYYEYGQFHEDIYIFERFIRTVSADNLPDLRTRANSIYGEN